MKISDTKTLDKTNTEFKQWWDLVAAVVFRKTGMEWELVLGDYPSRDSYDDGLSVYDCAMNVIETMKEEAEMMGFGEAF